MKPRTLFIFLFLILGTGLNCFAGDSTVAKLKRNIIFTTFSGQENFGSINYERVFSTGQKLNWSLSVGVQPFSLPEKFSVPLSLIVFTTGLKHHAEINMNADFFANKFHPYNGGWTEDYNYQLYLAPFIGYRYQKHRGLVARAGVGPQILLDPPSDSMFKTRYRSTEIAFFASFGISF